MTSRRSSGSMRAASAVEPTRSENITVTWRRSAVSCGLRLGRWQLQRRCRMCLLDAPQLGNGAKHLTPMTERRNANLFEVLIGQIGEGSTNRCRSRQSAARTRTCRAFRASPISPSSLARSRRQLVEQRLRLLQIERVEALGEPAVDRSEKLASLIPLALIAPEARETGSST